ncbi:PxKF domain-containing protein [Arthrobacter sp. D1-17]
MAAGTLLLTSAGMVNADDIVVLPGSVDAVAKVMPLNVGGAAGITQLGVVTTDGDGKPGCNLTGKTVLTLNITSSAPTVAKVEPSTVTFDSCGAQPTLTVTPVSAGEVEIAAQEASNTTGSTFNLLPAKFTVKVAPPSNTAPRLDITGTTTGGSYAKGSVPVTACKATDAEDGVSTAEVKLSAITGPDAATGIGTQTASCSYTDKGGLTASSSVTYTITDPTAPEVSYTLSPATADGLAGWYKSAVNLTWTVKEPDSPSTLDRTGCETKTVELDQLEKDYGCSAKSGGGAAEAVTVSIKKDGTAPTASYTTATGTLGDNGWYRSDVEALFTGADATSGLASSTQTKNSEGEGAAIKVTSPAFEDLAGNTSAAGLASETFKIDKTAPAVSYTSATGTLGGDGWYRSDVKALFTATDGTSGPAASTQTKDSVGEGEAVQITSPEFKDLAGNTRAAGAASETFKIDKTAPTAVFNSTLTDSYFGSTAAAPTCTATDNLSGPLSCAVSGYKTAVGTHTLTATATDVAGNTAIASQQYTVKAWTTKGFYQPVDMNGVLNTVKNGSTVPVKFEAFAGTTELTDPSLMTVKVSPIVCTPNAPVDDIELTAAGSTSLRYDAIGGQFIYHWKTPAAAGSCYRLTMAADDGSTIRADFKLK